MCAEIIPSKINGFVLFLKTDSSLQFFLFLLRSLVIVPDWSRGDWEFDSGTTMWKIRYSRVRYKSKWLYLPSIASEFWLDKELSDAMPSQFCWLYFRFPYTCIFLLLWLWWKWIPRIMAIFRCSINRVFLMNNTVYPHPFKICWIISTFLCEISWCFATDYSCLNTPDNVCRVYWRQFLNFKLSVFGENLL